MVLQAPLPCRHLLATTPRPQIIGIARCIVQQQRGAHFNGANTDDKQAIGQKRQKRAQGENRPWYDKQHNHWDNIKHLVRGVYSEPDAQAASSAEYVLKYPDGGIPSKSSEGQDTYNHNRMTSSTAMKERLAKDHEPLKFGNRNGDYKGSNTETSRTPDQWRQESKNGLQSNKTPPQWTESGGSQHAEMPKLSNDVRIALRNIPNPVVVITSGPAEIGEDTILIKPKLKPEKKLIRGMLVSSFNTITLTPTPYVSFNIKVPSVTWKTIQNTGRFKVHAIWDYKLAEDFAKPDPPTERKKINRVKTPKRILNELKQVRIFGLDCKLHSFHSIGDHVLVIGEVLDLLPGHPNTPGRKLEPPRCLVWQNGRWNAAYPIETRFEKRHQSASPRQRLQSDRVLETRIGDVEALRQLLDSEDEIKDLEDDIKV